MCEIAALVERLDLSEGTVLLVKMPGGASEEQFDIMSQAATQMVPPGVTFLIVPHDYEISVIENPELLEEKE